MQYDVVPVKKLMYSKFQGLSKNRDFCGDFGIAYPVYCKETIPGDIWRMRNGHKTLIMPQVSPLHSDVFLNTFAAFVPARLTDELFPKFLKGLNNDDSEYSTPLKSIQDVYKVWVADKDMILHDLYDFIINNGIENTVLMYKAGTASFIDSNLIDLVNPDPDVKDQAEALFKIFSDFETFKSFLPVDNWADSVYRYVFGILPFTVGQVMDFLQYPTLQLKYSEQFRLAFGYDGTNKKIIFNSIVVPDNDSTTSTWQFLPTWVNEPAYSTMPWEYVNYNDKLYYIPDFIDYWEKDYILPTRFFAYWYFYDDWFAHPDFDDPVACRWLRKGELGVPDDEFELLEDEEVPRVRFTPFTLLWHKDYFTGCLKNAQRGTPPALPVTITGSVSGLTAVTELSGGSVESTVDSSQAFTPGGNPSGSPSFSDAQPVNISGFPNSPYFGQGSSSVQTALTGAFDKVKVTSTLTNPEADTTITGTIANLDVVTFDISDFRLANAIQRFEELNNLAGRRWTDFLKIQYGTSPSDDVLERPDYFGRDKSPVNFNQIDSTVATDDDPLGTFAGRGSEVGIHSFRDYHPKEQGTIIVLAAFTVKNSYMSQGIPREMLRKTRFDYYNSLFSGIGDQEVLTRELYNDYSADDPENPSILGFQGRFDEYRVDNDDVAGECRLGSYKTFTLNRHFNSAPSLDSELFTHMHIDKTRFLAVPAEPTFYCHFENYINVLRPMPERSVPQLGL